MIIWNTAREIINWLWKHAPTHENNGVDEINVGGLSGDLADLQDPKDHTHQSAGSGVGGQLDHGLAMVSASLDDNDHTQYVLHTEVDDVPVDGVTTDPISSNWAYDLTQVTREPTGFPNITDTSAPTFSSPTITLAKTNGSFDFYIKGVKFTKSANQTVALPNGDATDIGTWYIAFNSSGVLTATKTTSWDLAAADTCPVAVLYFNGTAGKIADERHGTVMDASTHDLLHYTVGCRFESGLIGTFTDPTAIDIASGKIHDEDLEYSIGAQTQCIPFYHSSGVYTFAAAQNSYVVQVSDILQYDNLTNLVDVSNNSYVAYWIFATFDTTMPIWIMPGQREDALLKNARNNNKYESLSLGTLPFPEMKLLYRVILRRSGTSETYVETQDLRTVSNLPSGTYVATDHAALTGLLDDDHTQYILHSLADAANDFLVASGNDAFVKKTLAETLTLLGLDPLLDNSMADALHRHSELSASDGTPDRALVVDAAGQVGIGTASPAVKLEVAGTEIRVRTSITPKLSLWTDGADAGCRNWVLRTSHIAFGDFNIVQSNAKGGNPITAGTSRLYIDESGNVGIGVTDPGTKLEILNAGDQLKLSFDGADNAIFAVDTAGVLTITPSGAAVDFASKNLTGLGTLSAFTLGGTMDADSQALINVLDFDLGTESITGTFSATLTAANAGTAWLIKSKDTSDILRPRLGLSGGVDTAVWAWVNSTHTGIVLSGALDANTQALSNCGNITMNGASTVDGVDVSAHDANTTTAHGAVSAATASKHVVRDVSARAKFAAPGAAGDALIKGTRVTTAELPAMTDEKYWVGTGANVEERDVPAAGGIWTLLETLSPSGVTSIDSSAFAAKDLLMVILDASFDTGAAGEKLVILRFNDDTGNTYRHRVIDNLAFVYNGADTSILIGTSARDPTQKHKFTAELQISGKGGGVAGSWLGLSAKVAPVLPTYTGLSNGAWICGTANITKLNWIFSTAFTGTIKIYYMDF